MGSKDEGVRKDFFYIYIGMMLSAACEMLRWAASHLGRSLIVALLIAMILLGKD